MDRSHTMSGLLRMVSRAKALDPRGYCDKIDQVNST